MSPHSTIGRASECRYREKHRSSRILPATVAVSLLFLSTVYLFDALAHQETPSNGSIRNLTRQVHASQEESSITNAPEAGPLIPQKREECPQPATPPPLPGKKGVGFTLREPHEPHSWAENMPKVIALNPSWNYSWGSKRVEAQPDNIEFVPMVWGAWGGKDRLQQRISDDIIPQIKAGQAKRILGFNEPDSALQANLPVSTAVEFWPELQSVGLPLASPAPIKGDGEWINEFMEAANDSCLRMEYVAVHVYPGPDPVSFKRNMRNLYMHYGSRSPLLITEFAVADWNAKAKDENRYSQEQTLEFMKQVVPWLEAQDWIAGYAWFPFNDMDQNGHCSALFDSQGKLTPLGRFYASVSPDNPSGNQTITV